eukprot:m.277900 g.277900  ORF g.277900 m.277900 type:complete len:54 (-) comp132408_c0_seq1:441-602(-)
MGQDTCCVRGVKEVEKADNTISIKTWRNHRAWFAQFAMPTDYNDALHVEQRSN